MEFVKCDAYCDIYFKSLFTTVVLIEHDVIKY